MADDRLNEALLQIEQPHLFYRQMTTIAAEIDSPLLEVGDKEAIPALTKRGGAIARDVYDVDRLMNDVRAALRAQDEGDAGGGQLQAIASRMLEVETTLDAMSLETLQAKQDEWTERMAARPDKASIEAVAGAMAAPRLAGETMLTAQRIKWLYEAIILGDAEKLRTLSDKQLVKGVADLWTRTRAGAPDDQFVPLRRDLAEQRLRLRKQLVLMHLPEADVAELAAFYSSEEGRAKRDALIATFSRHNDEDGAAMLKRVLREEAAVSD